MNKKKKYLLSGISLGIVTVATTVGLMFGLSSHSTTPKDTYSTIDTSQEFSEATTVSSEQFFLLQDQQSGKHLSDVNNNEGYAYWTTEESIYGYSIVDSSEEGYLNIVSSNPKNSNDVLTISENNNIYWTNYDENNSENQNLVVLHDEDSKQYSIKFENGSFLNLSNISQQTTDTIAIASETNTPTWFVLEKLAPIWLDVTKLDYLGNYQVEIGLWVDSGTYTGPTQMAIIPNKDDDSVGGNPYAEVINVVLDQEFTVILDYSQWGVNPAGEFYTVQLVYGSVSSVADIATVTMEPADIEIVDVRYVGATIEVDYSVWAKTPPNDTNITNNIGSTNNKIYARIYDSTVAAPDSNTGWEEITPIGFQGEVSTWNNGTTTLPPDDFIIEFSSNDVSFDDPNDVDVIPDKGYAPTMAYDNQAIIPGTKSPWVQVSIHEVYGFIDVTNGTPTFTYNYKYDAITNRESHEMIINYEVNYMDSQNWVEIRVSGDGGTTWTSFVDGTSSMGPNTITLNVLPTLTASAYQVQLRVAHNETPTGSVWVDAVDTNSDYDGDGLPDAPLNKTKKQPSYIRVL